MTLPRKGGAGAWWAGMAGFDSRRAPWGEWRFQSSIDMEVNMLILSRKVDECITIGDDIVIRIVAIRGYAVRIGIDAPIDVPVHRLEVHEKVKAEEARRAEGGAGDA